MHYQVYLYATMLYISYVNVRCHANKNHSPSADDCSAIASIETYTRIDKGNIMAKKATKTEVTQTGTTPTSAPATAETRAPVGAPKNDTFKRIFGADGNPVAPSGKLAPQAQCIVNTLEAAGKDGMKREDLCKALTGVLVTRQPVGRIVSYYQKTLVNSGAIQIVS